MKSIKLTTLTNSISIHKINTGLILLQEGAQKMKNVSDDSFKNEILESEKPVLVDFWAEWCGPCKTIGPILEELDKELSEKMDIAKVNIDENPDTPIKYGVRGIPTLILFDNGKILDTKVGSLPKNQLLGWIESCLSNKSED